MINRCILIISALLVSLSPVYSPAATDTNVVFLTSAPDASVAAPIVYWSETRNVPRPVIIHFIRIDLQSREFEVFTMISDDPDGKGPADAKLEEPQKLASRNRAIVAVNANGFQSLRSNKNSPDSDWFAGKPVRIVGLAVSNGIHRSKYIASHFSFWIDNQAKSYLGIPEARETIIEAVSDWSGFLVHKGKIITVNTEKLHPRTLMGLDKSRRWLLLAVVDGRQPEVSEGVNLFESAEIMKKSGCHEAIAMDGGGSSIMLIKDASSDNTLQIINHPAGADPRPVPVMLGVRRRGSPLFKTDAEKGGL